MKKKLQQFMVGRYGMDDLNRMLNIVIFIPLILGLFVNPRISLIVMVMVCYIYYRTFSKNITARSAENRAYLKLKNKLNGRILSIEKRFSQRKEYRFYKCSQCHKTVRVPRGKGKIEITCTACHNRFIKRT